MATFANVRTVRSLMKYPHLFLSAFALFLFACGEGERQEEVQVIADPLESKQKAEQENASYYLVPTPNELFGLISDHEELDPNAPLNSVNNSSLYIDATSRALNFGVYATDLIYVSRSQNSVEVVRYFLTVKNLSEEMGISSAFDDRVFRQLESDITAGDSLDFISLEAYYHAYDALEQNEKGAELALLVTGGWIESMYLTIGARDTFELDGALEQRIAEQKYTLDNLIDLNQQNGNDAAVMLEKIRSIYDEMPIEDIPNDEKSTSGRMILGGRDQIRMSKEQYFELKETISDIRAKITLNESEEGEG